MNGPLVTVIMPSYQAERYIADAIRSVLSQTLGDLELIVVDDASRDDSCRIAADIARTDPRVRVERLARNSGPAAARNAAIALARGRWLALLDSDDLYHPDRLRRLVLHAEVAGADLVADDLLPFGEEGGTGKFLSGPFARPRSISLADYLRATGRWRSQGDLGYLKPIFRADTLRRTGIGYDERLHIGEDDDLIVRLLMAGARYRLLPVPTYFYRRHDASISSRPALSHLRAMAESSARHLAAAERLDPAHRRALRDRLTARRRALHWEELVAALKAREPARAARALSLSPTPLTMAWRPVAARLGRRSTAPLASAAARDGRILFAGEADGPTALALDWFFDAVWPEVQEARPDARLTVAGTAARLLPDPAPAGVDGEERAPVPASSIEIAPFRIPPSAAPPARRRPAAAERIATSAGLALAAAPDTRVTVADDAPAFAAALVGALDRAGASHD